MVEPDVSMIDLRVLPMGRLLYALGGVRAAITDGDAEAPLRERVDAALADGRATHALERQFAGQTSKAQHGEDAPEVDAELDRALTGLDDALAQNPRTFGRDAPISVASRKLKKELLPRGAGAITSLDYVQELETVDTLLKTGAKPDLVALIGTANVQPHIDRITTVLAQFRGTVGGGQAGAIGFDQVRSGRARAQRNLRKVVAWVLGHYLDDGDADVAARERLLRPILDQNDELHRKYAARRPVTDVDPETGKEVTPAAGS